MLDTNDAIPLGHDGYLKLWALQKPKLNYEFVLLDEAQDTNQVVLDVLVGQATQMVYVGDRHQQIYEWRGAVNAMGKIETEHSAYLTQSFRFGEPIANAATDILKTMKEKRAIKGNPNVESRISHSGDANAILARTNSGVIAETLAEASNGRKPHIVGGTAELERLVGDVFNLQKNEPGLHPDFLASRIGMK